jgi:MFS family permease
MVCAGYLAADAFQPFWILCASFFAVGAGSALAIPSANALGSLAVSREEQGAAAALMSAAPPAGFIFGPLIGAALYSVSPALPLVVSAVLVGGLAVYAGLVTARRPLTPP